MANIDFEFLCFFCCFDRLDRSVGWITGDKIRICRYVLLTQYDDIYMRLLFNVSIHWTFISYSINDISLQNCENPQPSADFMWAFPIKWSVILFRTKRFSNGLIHKYLFFLLSTHIRSVYKKIKSLKIINMPEPSCFTQLNTQTRVQKKNKPIFFFAFVISFYRGIEQKVQIIPKKVI